MRWCTVRNCPVETIRSNDHYTTALQEKEQVLKLKEKELLKQDKELQKKALKLQKHSNKKAKADLKAADKLRKARKKLILVLNAKGKVENGKKKKSKRKGGKVFRSKAKKSKVDLHSCLYNMLTKVYRPCGYGCSSMQNRMHCSEQKTDMCLRKLFSRPYECRLARTCLDHRTRFQPYRCEIPWNRRSYRNAAGDCFLMSLRRTPQVWMYHRWPKLYPQYLSARAQWRSLGHCLLFAAAFMLWTPCILCLALSKCFWCSCCTDNC